jgi:membrane-bound inhibitor of C-type lysozyme
MSAVANQKVFIYCSESASTDTVTYFKHKDYLCRPLNDDPKTFWNAISSSGSKATVVIYTHGDENGPLMVTGQVGDDMTDEEIVKLDTSLSPQNSTLYLLSCRTGSGIFKTKLDKTDLNYVAPLGYALLKSSSAGVSAYSVNPERHTEHMKWGGKPVKLIPTRPGKPLNIP